MSAPTSDEVSRMPSTDKPILDDQPRDDAALAAHIAEQAGTLLLEIRAEAMGTGGTAGSTGVRDRGLGDDGDRRAHDLIAAALRAQRPGDAVLSEEGVQPGAGGRIDESHGRRRIWI